MSSAAKVALALLERKLHNTNLKVELLLKLAHEAIGDCSVPVDNVVKQIAGLQLLVQTAKQTLTGLVAQIDQQHNTQYAPWFNSKLRTERVGLFDIDTLAARLANARGIQADVHVALGLCRLHVASEHAAIVVSLRLRLAGVSQVSASAEVALAPGLLSQSHTFSGGQVIFDNCTLRGDRCAFAFVLAPAAIVERIENIELVEETDILRTAESWMTKSRTDDELSEIAAGERDIRPPSVTETESVQHAVLVDFDVKSLLANERTFLSWTNVAMGVATVGVYAKNVILILTGLGFIWLALVLLILRRKSINQEKVSLVIRSPWFATLFASFLLAVIAFRIVSS